MTPTEDNITTTTLQLIRKRLADNIFKANPTAAYLLMRGRVELVNGGKRIDEPLMYATNQTVKAYKAYDRFNVAPTEELTFAFFNWRQLAGTVGISGLEDLENSGPQAIFNLLQAKIRVLDLSMRQFFDEKLHGAASSKDPARDFLGLDELIERAVAASQSTVGGIDRSTEQWWANKFIDNSGDVWGASTTKLTSHLTSMYYEVTKGLTQPDVIITSQGVFERYENDNRDKLRLHDTRLMDVGFMNFKFKNAVMMWNENILTPGANQHLVYFLNTEFIRIVLHTRRNFVMTPFMKPIDQDAKVAQMLAAGNMTVNNSRFQGVMLEQSA